VTLTNILQVAYLYAMCASETCRDPTDLKFTTLKALNHTETTFPNNMKRQTGLMTRQDPARDDLSFVSTLQSNDNDPTFNGHYIYDSSAGDDVYLYILDFDQFDMDFSVSDTYASRSDLQPSAMG